MSDIKNSHELWFVKSCDYKGLRETFDALDGEIDKLEAENAALKEAQRWIPVSERLPEAKGWYPVVIKTWRLPNAFQDDVFYEPKTGWERDVDDEILFWMHPLPEIPEVNK